MLLFILVPILVARVRGYKLSSAFRVMDLYPLFVLELLHLFFQFNALFGNYAFVKFAKPLQYGFILVLLVPIIRRSLYKPALVGASGVLVGSALNRLVISANGGKMPVFPSLSLLTGFYKPGALEGNVDSLHVLMTESTHLNFLGDYLDFGLSIISIGDVFIHIFASLIIFYTIKACKEST